MVRDICATAHCDFSAQVDRLRRTPLCWVITGGVALMIATTGRLTANFKTKGVRSDSVRRGKCRQVDTASIDKNARFCQRIYEHGVRLRARDATPPPRYESPSPRLRARHAEPEPPDTIFSFSF
jgi:hypothetical protein